MVHGDICPHCGSKNVYDNDFHYTYDNPSKISADWFCEDCGSSYDVIYEAKEMKVVPYEINEEEGWEDLNYDKEYTKKI